MSTDDRPPSPTIAMNEDALLSAEPIVPESNESAMQVSDVTEEVSSTVAAQSVLAGVAEAVMASGDSGDAVEPMDTSGWSFEVVAFDTSWGFFVF